MERETPGDFAEWLAAVAAAGIDVACLRLPAPPPGFPLDRARVLVRGAQALGIAVLLEDKLELALELGADGLHVFDPAAPLGELRRALGPERSLGAACGVSRHLAIEAAEREVDYVSFAGPDDVLFEIVGWWADMMTPPVVAEGVRDPVEAAALAEAGADFVAPEFDMPRDARDLAPLLAFAAALGGGIRAEA